MMHVATSAIRLTNTGGHPIRLPANANIVDRMIHELYGYRDSLRLTELRIHTTTLTDVSPAPERSGPLLMIEGRVARIRHESDTISYWIDGPDQWVWDKSVFPSGTWVPVRRDD